MSSIAPEAPNVNDMSRVTNHTFGGMVNEVGKTAYLMNPLSISCWNIICGIPYINYTADDKGIEYAMKTTGCFCCKKKMWKASRLDGVKLIGKPDAKVQLATTKDLSGACCGNIEYLVQGQDGGRSFAIHDDAKLVKCLGSPCLAILTCFQIHIAGWNQFKQFMSGKVMRTVTIPFYSHGVSKEEDNVPFGYISMTNLHGPTACCPEAFDLQTMQIKIHVADPEKAASLSEDDKAKLSLFAFSIAGGLPSANPFLGALRGGLGVSWMPAPAIGVSLLDMGRNATATYQSIGEAVAGGMFETGDLIPRMKKKFSKDAV